MIEVNYNEYKETIAQNMKLIVENHDLKEEIEKLNNIIDKAIEKINKALCPNSDYVDYEFGDELLRQELLDILRGE